MESLTLKQIIDAVNGQCLQKEVDLNLEIRSISIDSRDIKKEALYIPIKGDRFDGHTFIEDAFNKGATIALAQDQLIESENGILIYVKDTSQALKDLAAYYRNQFSIPVVAITGSVGKTSTKDLLSAVLGGKYKVHKTDGNFNNEIGLPLTIFGLNQSHEVLVVEMGMNNFGEIHNLSQIARPDIAVITNVGDSHIENLGSREGVLKAKAEIVDGMTQDGILIVNGEDEMLSQIKDEQTLITYGHSEKHPFFVQNVETIGTKGVSATFNTPLSVIDLMIPVLGRHMIDNALAAIAVAQKLQLTDSQIKAGFELYKPTKMRMDLKRAQNNVTIINDAYNASPDSMKAALDVLADIPNMKRRIAILGDMFEMGEHAEALHREVGRYIGENQVADLLITVGDMSSFIQEEAVECGMSHDQTLHFKNQENLTWQLKNLISPGDLVLVKASRGMKLEKTVDEIEKVNLNES